jgi:uncharacterized protein YdaU (DUF1376 family)
MAEFPALPLWTDAYLGDTTHLTTIEHGAYLLLLFTAWRSPNYDLPDNDGLLARFCHLTPGQWARIKPTIMAYWKLENGRWFNGRLLDERDAVRRKVLQRSDAGKASALKRLHRGSTGVERNSYEIPTSKATPTTITIKKEKAAPLAQRFVPPDFIPNLAWDDFLEMRKKQRKPATEKAKALLARSLEKLMIQGHDPATVLEQSTVNGWTDVYPIKEKENGNGRIPRKSNHETFYDAASAVAARIASRGNGEAGGPEQATILLLPTGPDKTSD